jgi:CofD-related protein of GAK system
MSSNYKATGNSSFADSIDRSTSTLEESEKDLQQPVITISRTVTIPDVMKVDRCYRLPEYGPRILFFSGGSAIKELSSVLKHYTHNSIHLITPFDSGGSSAELRRAFDMLSVGDLRNRLMALSDDSSALGNPQVSHLFSHRLSKLDGALARSEFSQLLSGTHALARAVSLPMRSILISHLRWFAHRMPPDFDLCGASIGNLIITGCFLEHDSDIVTAIYLIWKLLGVKGKVRPLTGANLHIRTLYEDGTEEVGQHKLGKQSKVGVHGRILKVDLVENLYPKDDDEMTRQESQQCQIDMLSSELVASADVICFPMGSFFGSLLVNLMPEGVGTSIVQRHCPKLYIPNTGVDPEMYGYTLSDCVNRIIGMVRADAGETVDVSQILNFVLVDTTYCQYCVDVDREAIEYLGIVVVDLPLVDEVEQQYATDMLEKSKVLNPVKVVEVLLTLG